MSEAAANGNSNAMAAANLIERAKNLATRLRERTAETNQLRRLPDATWNDLLETGILRALQPTRWGGGELDLSIFYSAVMEVARAEGCAGWVAGIIGAHPWQTALYSEKAQREIWGDDPTVMNSSSYAPTGKATRVAGGYRLEGRWSFSSGCDHSQWVNLGAVPGTIEVEGRELPDFRSFILPRTDYRVDDNWQVAGLAGTGSKDIVVNDALVPDYRSMSHWDLALGRSMPGWEINPGPLFRLPFGPLFFGALSAAVLGAAEGFLENWIENGRGRSSGMGLKLADDPYSLKLVAEASYAIRSARLKFLHDSDEMMQTAREGGSFIADQCQVATATSMRPRFSAASGEPGVIGYARSIFPADIELGRKIELKLAR